MQKKSDLSIAFTCLNNNGKIGKNVVALFKNLLQFNIFHVFMSIEEIMFRFLLPSYDSMAVQFIFGIGLNNCTFVRRDL